MTTQLTVGDIKSHLVQSGIFAEINSQSVDRLRRVANRNRFADALTRAPRDEGARQFLINCLQQAQIHYQLNPSAGGAAHRSGYGGPSQRSTPAAPAPAPARENPSTPRPAASPPAERSRRAAAPPPEPSSAAPTAPEREASGKKPDRYSVHVYGGKAALCFEADQTRGGDFTVAIDAALAVPDRPREYDWKNKIRIQLTRTELPHVAAVLIGASGKFAGSNHGPGNDKGFEIIREGQQNGKVFMKVMAKGEAIRAVPIERGDLYYVTGLFLRQLRKAQPWMDGQGIINVLRALYR